MVTRFKKAAIALTLIVTMFLVWIALDDITTGSGEPLFEEYIFFGLSVIFVAAIWFFSLRKK